MATVTVDVPAFGVNDDVHMIFDSNALSTPDTGTELVLDQSSQPLRITIYSMDGSGSGNIALPDPPAGGTLASATYVVIAYAESSETLTDPTGWSPDTPNPTQAPFLMIDSSATGFNPTMDPIPVGAYAGETVWSGNDVFGVTSDIPANRIWLQSYSDIPIHVAYAAVRLTYTVPDERSITGDLGPNRTRFVA